MIRRIIKIDQEKCNGCGACATACHEGAIDMVNGKAVLTREDYCDGLGDCLPACPSLPAFTYNIMCGTAANMRQNVPGNEKKLNFADERHLVRLCRNAGSIHYYICRLFHTTIKHI